SPSPPRRRASWTWRRSTCSTCSTACRAAPPPNPPCTCRPPWAPSGTSPSSAATGPPHWSCTGRRTRRPASWATRARPRSRWRAWRARWPRAAPTRRRPACSAWRRRPATGTTPRRSPPNRRTSGGSPGRAGRRWAIRRTPTRTRRAASWSCTRPVTVSPGEVLVEPVEELHPAPPRLLTGVHPVLAEGHRGPAAVVGQLDRHHRDRIVRVAGGEDEPVGRHHLAVDAVERHLEPLLGGQRHPPHPAGTGVQHDPVHRRRREPRPEPPREPFRRGPGGEDVLAGDAV